MQNNSIKKDKSIVFIIALCLFFLSYFYIRSSFVFRLEKEILSTSLFFRVFIVSFFFIALFGLFHRQKKINVTIWLLGAYIFIIYFSTVKVSISNFISGLSLIFWVVCFSFGNRLSNANGELQLFFIKIVNIIIVLPLLLYSIFMFFTTNLIINQAATDAFFTVIVYLPFVMMLQEKKALKIILFLLMIIATIISMKRSLIIGVVACSLIYIMLTEHRKVFLKWYFWILLLVIVYLSYYFYNIVSETLFYRFAQLEEDGGTGRNTMYNTVLNAFVNSDLISIIFGHGYQSVTLILKKLAHNDFLQLLYDCGLIGTGLYIIFMLSLIALAIRKYRTRKVNKKIYAAFISTLVLYLILSSLNCFIYSMVLISPIMLELGLMSGIIKTY